MQVRGHMEVQAGAVCKPVGSAYVGSNPTPATSFPQVKAGAIGWWHRLLRAGASGSRTVCGPAVGQAGWRAGVLRFGFELAKRLSIGLPGWPAVGVICGLSAGRAGKSRTHGGRRPRSSRLVQPLVFPPSRAVGATVGFFTDGHGPRPSGGPGTRPICWLSRSSWPLAASSGPRARARAACQARP